MAQREELQRQLKRLNDEIAKLRKQLIRETSHDQEQADAVWEELMVTSAQISARWNGPGAVEEIASQRGK